MKNKFIATIADALRQCGLADGMTLSFHHHLRNGDHVVNMTLDVVASLGIKNITVACSSSMDHKLRCSISSQLLHFARTTCHSLSHRLQCR